MSIDAAQSSEITIFEKWQNLLVPATVLATVAGCIQDLVIPIAEIGHWLALPFIIFAIIVLCIPTHSSPGLMIQKFTKSWKYPVVVSFFSIGVGVLIMANYSSSEENPNGVLATNFKVMENLQRDLLDLKPMLEEIDKTTKDTNRVVKDTNQVVKGTNVVVKDTNQVVKNTDSKVDKIIENTKSKAVDLLTERGYDTSDAFSFYQAVDDLSGDELTSVLQLFKDAKFSTKRKIAVFPYLMSDNQQKSQLILRMPKRTDVIHGMIYQGFSVQKITAVLDIFSNSEFQITANSDWYALDTLNPNFQRSMGETPGIFVVHPQQRLSTIGLSNVSISLISYPLSRQNKLTNNRGSYSLLHTSAALGDLPLVKQLIKRGHNLEATSVSGYTPLALTIEHAHLDIAQYLIEHGASAASNNQLAIEVSLLKAIEGLYPSSAIQAGGKLAKKPNDNPYIQLAEKMLRTTGKNKTVILSVQNVYEQHLSAIKKERSPVDFPGTVSYRELNAKISIIKAYIESITSFY